MKTSLACVLNLFALANLATAQPNMPGNRPSALPLPGMPATGTPTYNPTYLPPGTPNTPYLGTPAPFTQPYVAGPSITQPPAPGAVFPAYQNNFTQSYPLQPGVPAGAVSYSVPWTTYATPTYSPAASAATYPTYTAYSTPYYTPNSVYVTDTGRSNRSLFGRMR